MLSSTQLTQDTTFESNKYTIKHHTQESQKVTLFPAGDHKGTMNRQKNMANTNHKYQNDPQKKHRLELLNVRVNIASFSAKLNILYYRMGFFLIMNEEESDMLYNSVKMA